MVSTQPIPMRPETKAAVSVAISIAAGPFREETVFALTRLGIEVVHDQREATDLAGLIGGLERARADVLLFDLREGTEKVLAERFSEIRRRLPNLRIVAIHPSDDSQAILTAMRIGATEFIHSPMLETIGPALDRISRMDTVQSSPDRRGKVIGVVSAKGGCGATTVTCHLAAELKRQTQQEVLLGDLDLECGIVGFLLKVASQYSIFDAVDNLSRLDSDLWAAFLTKSKNGLNILPGPVRAGRSEVDGEELQRVVRFMRTHHDWVVLDLGRGPNGLAIAAMEEVDDLLVISSLDVAALHMAKVVMRALPSLETKARCHLVLNRTQKSLDVSRDEVEKIFGQKLFAAIPDEYGALYSAYAAGTLVPSDSKLGRHFGSIASQFAGVPEKKPKKFSFFG